MKLSGVSLITPGHPGDVSRATNILLDRLAEDQRLHLCRPRCKTVSDRYTNGLTWETAAQEGHEKGLGGNSRLQNGGDRLLLEWRAAASGVEPRCSRVRKGALVCLLGVVLLCFVSPSF